MVNWLLWFSLMLLLLLSMVFVVYPLRKQKGFAILMVVIYVGGTVLAYLHWGGLSQWLAHQQALSQAADVKKLAAQYQTPAQLILKLKSQLDDTPKSAQGWYLLGKLYGAQGDWKEADLAFSKAFIFKPNHEQYAIQAIYARWMLHHQQMNQNMHVRIKKLLAKFPNQPDLMMMLAMDAFETQHYQRAIDYWQLLLKQAPPGSEARLKLQEAIARAETLKKKR